MADNIIVSRDNSIFQVDMANSGQIKETDYILVNRDGVLYKASGNAIGSSPQEPVIDTAILSQDQINLDRFTSNSFTTQVVGPDESPEGQTYLSATVEGPLSTQAATDPIATNTYSGGDEIPLTLDSTVNLGNIFEPNDAVTTNTSYTPQTSLITGVTVKSKWKQDALYSSFGNGAVHSATYDGTKAFNSSIAATTDNTIAPNAASGSWIWEYPDGIPFTELKFTLSKHTGWQYDSFKINDVAITDESMEMIGSWSPYAPTTFAPTYKSDIGNTLYKIEILFWKAGPALGAVYVDGQMLVDNTVVTNPPTQTDVDLTNSQDINLLQVDDSVYDTREFINDTVYSDTGDDPTQWLRLFDNKYTTYPSVSDGRILKWTGRIAATGKRVRFMYKNQANFTGNYIEINGTRYEQTEFVEFPTMFDCGTFTEDITSIKIKRNAESSSNNLYYYWFEVDEKVVCDSTVVTGDTTGKIEKINFIDRANNKLTLTGGNYAVSSDALINYSQIWSYNRNDWNLQTNTTIASWKEAFNGTTSANVRDSSCGAKVGNIAILELPVEISGTVDIWAGHRAGGERPGCAVNFLAADDSVVASWDLALVFVDTAAWQGEKVLSSPAKKIQLVGGSSTSGECYLAAVKLNGLTLIDAFREPQNTVKTLSPKKGQAVIKSIDGSNVVLKSVTDFCFKEDMYLLFNPAKSFDVEPTTSAILSYTPSVKTLTLTDDKDLGQFAAGDFVYAVDSNGDELGTYETSDVFNVELLDLNGTVTESNTAGNADIDFGQAIDITKVEIKASGIEGTQARVIGFEDINGVRITIDMDEITEFGVPASASNTWVNALTGNKSNSLYALNAVGEVYGFTVNGSPLQVKKIHARRYPFNGSDTLSYKNIYINGIQIDTYLGTTFSKLEFSDGTALDKFIKGEQTYTAAPMPINQARWLGNGISRSISGVGFVPDMVWIKQMDNTRAPTLYDTVRGANNRLITSSKNSFSQRNDELMSFDFDGFTIGTNANVNASGEFVAWCFKAGGKSVKNYDGTLFSDVSANDETGMSIVKWKCNETAKWGDTVGHGLSKTPEFVVIKRKASSNWLTYHKDLPEKNYLYLNSSAGGFEATDALPEAPNDAVLTLGTNNDVQGNDSEVIAYCWTSTPGVCHVGSYSGNANPDNGPVLNCGFTPGFIMIKNVTTAGSSTNTNGSWVMLDLTRNPNNPLDQLLFADKSDKTVDLLTAMATSNGFQIATNNIRVNANGNDYVYIAWAGSQPVTTIFDTSEIADNKIQIINNKVGLPDNKDQIWRDSLSASGVLLEPENAFMGFQEVIFRARNNTSGIDETLVFAPASGLNFTSTIEVLNLNGSSSVFQTAEWNGNTPVSMTKGEWVTVYEGAGTINTLQPLTIKQTSNAKVYLNAIRIDGRLLVDTDRAGEIRPTKLIKSRRAAAEIADVNLLANSLVFTDASNDNWETQTFAKGVKKSAISSKAYLKFDANGLVESVTSKPVSPQLMNSRQPKLTFPATFMTGVVPDQELVEPTSLQTIITRTNDLGSASETTNLLFPSSTATSTIAAGSSEVYTIDAYAEFLCMTKSHEGRVAEQRAIEYQNNCDALRAAAQALANTFTEDIP